MSKKFDFAHVRHGVSFFDQFEYCMSYSGNHPRQPSACQAKSPCPFVTTVSVPFFPSTRTAACPSALQLAARRTTVPSALLINAPHASHGTTRTNVQARVIVDAPDDDQPGSGQSAVSAAADLANQPELLAAAARLLEQKRAAIPDGTPGSAKKKAKTSSKAMLASLMGAMPTGSPSSNSTSSSSSDKKVYKAMIRLAKHMQGEKRGKLSGKAFYGILCAFEENPALYKLVEDFFHQKPRWFKDWSMYVVKCPSDKLAARLHAHILASKSKLPLTLQTLNQELDLTPFDNPAVLKPRRPRGCCPSPPRRRTPARWLTFWARSASTSRRSTSTRMRTKMTTPSATATASSTTRPRRTTTSDASVCTCCVVREARARTWGTHATLPAACASTTASCQEVTRRCWGGRGNLCSSSAGLLLRMLRLRSRARGSAQIEAAM